MINSKQAHQPGIIHKLINQGYPKIGIKNQVHYSSFVFLQNPGILLAVSIHKSLFFSLVQKSYVVIVGYNECKATYLVFEACFFYLCLDHHNHTVDKPAIGKFKFYSESAIGENVIFASLQ
jgi:hypothetical protein